MRRTPPSRRTFHPVRTLVVAALLVGCSGGVPSEREALAAPAAVDTAVASACDVIVRAQITGQRLTEIPAPEDVASYIRAGRDLAEDLADLGRHLEDIGRPDDVTLATMAARAATYFHTATDALVEQTAGDALLPTIDAAYVEQEVAWLPAFDRELGDWYEHTCDAATGATQ